MGAVSHLCPSASALLAPTVPTVVPAELVAGDSWKVDLSYGDYPASAGWTLTLHIRGAGVLNAVATASGDVHQVRATPAQTAALPAGTYRWVARVSDGTDAYAADGGTLVVRDNLATAGTGDLQSHAERMLAAIEAELRARLTGDGSAMDAYGVGGQQFSKVPLETLTKLRTRYAFQVAMERNRGQLPPVAMRFSRVC